MPDMGHKNEDFHRRSVFRSIYNRNDYCDNRRSQRNLEASCKDSADFVQRLGLLRKLEVHNGCVNSVNWNATGEYLLSGSDDQYLVITNPHTSRVLLRYKTAHYVNIFSCRFMPHSEDHAVVSCSGDGVVLHTEFLAPYANLPSSKNYDPTNTVLRHEHDVNESYFACHKTGTAYDVLTLPHEPRCFLSCGEDGTVRFYDLRTISRCTERQCRRNILVLSPSAINAMDIAPINHYQLAVGCADSIVRIYDRRQLSVIDSKETCASQTNYQTPSLRSYPIPVPERRLYRTTCVRFSPDESELLVSYSSDYLYLYDLKHSGFDAVKLLASGRYMSKMTRPNRSDGTGPRLRLRGDWSDTGPNARPENELQSRIEIGQVRPALQDALMTRIAELISRSFTNPQVRTGMLGVGDTSMPQSQGLPVLGSSDNANNESVAEQQLTARTPPARQSVASRVWRRAIMRTIEDLAPQREQSTQTEPVPAAPADDETPNATSEVQAPKSENEQSIDDESDESDPLTPDNSANVETAADIAAPPDDQSYVRIKFTGHRNSRTMIKSACFWGNQYIMSGSDCGHIFIWERGTGKLVKLIEADKHVVNRVVPHPHLPYLASSGIDYDIKLWAPIDYKHQFDQEYAITLIQRNAVMLMETMDTITVPAPMLMRLLTGIHTIRSRNRNRNRTANDDDSLVENA